MSFRVFADFFVNKKKLFFLSRSHTISTRYILPVGNTLYRKPHNTRTICITPLQSTSEAGLHSRQSFLVRLLHQFDAFFNPKKASDTARTKATNKQQVFKANINNNRQQELLSCCFCDHVSPNINMLWLLLCYLRVPFQLGSPPGFHFNTHPEGEPSIKVSGTYMLQNK